MSDNRSDMERLADFQLAVAELERWLDERAEQDRREDFNIFEVAGIVNAEIRHSNMIAWLINPHGGHGVGAKVLAKLIEHAGGIAPEDMEDFAIKREADHIDILALSSKNRMALAIENKVWSGEHDNQLSRYKRITESKYRNWEHFYLYLTPDNEPPESDEDAEAWKTLGYGDLADIVQGAADQVELLEKPRILIEDYLDCIRRHIVGNEELSERCVEIYADHKRAIDLIMANVPDVAKMVHDYARKWARCLDGATVVEECSGGKKFVRFRTERLDEFFPKLDKVDSWGQNSFWFYELVANKSNDDLSCTLKLQICFNHPKKADLPKDWIDTMRSFIDALDGGEGRTFFKKNWSGCVGKRVRFDLDGFEYSDVVDVCETFWDDFRRREEGAIREVFGDAISS